MSVCGMFDPKLVIEPEKDKMAVITIKKIKLVYIVSNDLFCNAIRIYAF
jgi:hypothetical protein